MYRPTGADTVTARRVRGRSLAPWGPPFSCRMRGCAKRNTNGAHDPGPAHSPFRGSLGRHDRIWVGAVGCWRGRGAYIVRQCCIPSRSVDCKRGQQNAGNVYQVVPMKLTQSSITTLSLPPGKTDAVVFDPEIPASACGCARAGRTVGSCSIGLAPSSVELTLGAMSAINLLRSP